MALLLLLAAIALPNIDLASNCRAEQKVLPPNPEQGNIYESCMKAELTARDALKKKWATVPASVRATCAEMGSLGGSYVEIDVCIDVDTGKLSTYASPPRPPRRQ